MLPEFQKSCNEVINKWEELVSKKGSYELDVLPDVEDLASNAIARTAFGTNNEEGNRIFDLQRELAELTIRALTSPYIPGWRYEFVATQYS